MNISEDKQIFKCFVCGAGGNVFSFVQKYEKISFIEAVYKVAEYSGVTLSAPLERVSAPAVDPHIAALHKVLDEMIQYTRYELDTEAGAQCRAYLGRRGLDEEIIPAGFRSAITRMMTRCIAICTPKASAIMTWWNAEWPGCPAHA